MDENTIDPELKELFDQVKLKEPPERVMSDYLAGVRAKIDQGIGKPGFEFSGPLLLAVAGITLIGAAWFLLGYFQPQSRPFQELQPVSAVPLPFTQTVQPVLEERASPVEKAEMLELKKETLPDFGFAQGIPSSETGTEKAVLGTDPAGSLEENAAILEALGVDFTVDVMDEAVEFFGDDELLEELSLMDDLELSQTSAQTARSTVFSG